MHIAPGQLKLRCRDVENPTYAYVITENSVQAKQLEHFKADAGTFSGERSWKCSVKRILCSSVRRARARLVRVRSPPAGPK